MLVGDVDRVRAGRDRAWRSLERDRVHVGAVGDDLDLFGASTPDFVLKVGDLAAVAATRVRDDIDAPLLDEDANVLARFERDLVAMIVAPKQPPLDGLAAVEPRHVRRPPRRERTDREQDNRGCHITVTWNT